MRELGYVEGKNVAYEVRRSESRFDELPRLATELITAKVDVIVAIAPAAIRAAKQASNSTPVVMAFWGGPDLVESGVIASFARPGGNVTGVHMLTSELDSKRLELLRQVVPTAKKIAVLYTRPLFEPQLIFLRRTAPSLGVQLAVMEVGDESRGYEIAFESMVREGVEALVVPSSPKLFQDRKSIIPLAAKYRIPAIYEWSVSAADGGLMAYGPTLAEMDRQSAKLVDKILKGAKPADLARRAAHEVRAGDQPQDREGPRTNDPAVAAAAGGRAHPVIDRRTFLAAARGRCSSPRRLPRRRSPQRSHG